MQGKIDDDCLPYWLGWLKRWHQAFLRMGDGQLCINLSFRSVRSHGLRITILNIVGWYHTTQGYSQQYIRPWILTMASRKIRCLLICYLASVKFPVLSIFNFEFLYIHSNYVIPFQGKQQVRNKKSKSKGIKGMRY